LIAHLGKIKYKILFTRVSEESEENHIAPGNNQEPTISSRKFVEEASNNIETG